MFYISTESLKDVVTNLKKYIADKSVNINDTCFNFIVSKESLKIFVSNVHLGVFISYKMDQENDVSQEISFSIPSVTFECLLKVIKGGLWYFNLIPDEDCLIQVTFSSYRTVYKLKKIILDVSDYKVYDFDLNNSVEISLDVFKQYGSCLMSSVSRDKYKGVLNTVAFNFKGRNLEIVSTDGVKLTKVNVYLDKNIGNMKLLIEQEVFGNLVNQLKKEIYYNVQLSVTSDKEYILFKVGSFVFQIRLVDLNYIDYTYLMDSYFKDKKSDSFIFERKTLIKNIETLVNLLKKEKFVPEFKLSFRNKFLTISNEIKDQRAFETFGLLSVEQDYYSFILTDIGSFQKDIHLNLSYLLNILKNLDIDLVTLEYYGKLVPLVVSMPSSFDFSHMIMPVND